MSIIDDQFIALSTRFIQAARPHLDTCKDKQCHVRKLVEAWKQ